MKTPAFILAWVLWPAVALLTGCAGLGLPEPRLPELELPKLSDWRLPKAPSEDVAQKRRHRSEATARRLEKNRDFAEYQAARFCRQQGDEEGAERALANLLKRNPDHRAARLMMADLLIEQDRPAEAVQNVRHVLAKSPSDAGAHHALAVLLDGSGDEAGALEHYQRAATLKPASEVYRVSYQTALASAESPEAEPGVVPLPPVPRSPAVSAAEPEKPAEAALKQPSGTAQDVVQAGGLPKRPESVPSSPSSTSPPPAPVPVAGAAERVDRAKRAGFDDDVQQAGRVQAASGAGPVADAGYAAADSSATGRRPAGNARSAAELTETGQREMSAGNTATATAFFRKAMAANPDDPQIPTTAAMAALRHHQPAAAIELLQEAVRAFPKSASLHQILAVATYRQGDYGASQVAAQQALSLDNTSALSYFLLGSAQARLGQAEAAEVHLRQARRLDPRYGVTR